MNEQGRYWQKSLVGRALTALAVAAKNSVVSRMVTGLGAGLAMLGRGSLAAGLMQLNWGGQGWLTGSRLVPNVARLGRRLETVSITGAKRLQTAWTASRVGGKVSRLVQDKINGARFWSGILLGLAVGTVAFGKIAGVLTGRRLLAAATMAFVGGLLMVPSVDIQVWIGNSKLLQWIQSLSNLGARQNP